MLVFTMMALGLNVVVGYAVSSTSAMSPSTPQARTARAGSRRSQFEDVTLHLGSTVCNELPGIHLSMWLVLIIAGVFTTIVGILIGLPTLRLRGDYLAIVTLGFGEIVPQFVRNADEEGLGFDLTHGTFGISPIDSFGIRLVRLPARRTTRTTSSTGRRSCSSCSRSSAVSGCATRVSGGPGSRSARTRRPRPPWASR